MNNCNICIHVFEHVFYRRFYHHDNFTVLQVVQNPDFAHVVDLHKLKKVEMGEVDGKKCVSLFFTEKLQKSKETVMFVVRAVYSGSLILHH